MLLTFVRCMQMRRHKYQFRAPEETPAVDQLMDDDLQRLEQRLLRQTINEKARIASNAIDEEAGELETF